MSFPDPELEDIGAGCLVVAASAAIGLGIVLARVVRRLLR